EIGEIPSEEGTPRALSVVLPPEEAPSELTSELPSEVPSEAPAPSTVPSISSPSDVSSVRPEDVPLPESVASESGVELSPSPSSVTSLQLPPPTTETSIDLTPSPSIPSSSVPLESEDGTPSSIHFTEEEGSTASVEPPTTSVPRTEYPSEPSSSSISASAPSSSSSASTLQLPTTVPSTSLTLSGLTVTTESSLTPTIPPTIDESSSPSSRSPQLPPSPTPWASETNISYESSQLEPSPSIRSIALHEGPDISFETSFLRPTASYSSLDRMSTIPPTPTASSSAPPQRLPPISPILPPPPSLDLGSEVPTPSSLMFSESSQLARSSSVRSTTSVSSGMSQTSITSSMLDSSSVIDEMEEREREESMRMSEVSTEPSLLTTPRASRVGTPSVRSLSTVTPSASISVSISTPQGDKPSTRSTLYTVQSPSLRPPSVMSYGERPSEPPVRPVSVPDLSRDINQILDEIRLYDQNREDENREMGQTLQDLQNELRDISNFLHRPQPQYAEERVGRSTASKSKSSTSVSASIPIYDDLSLVPPIARLSRATSSASSISFLSSHHSDDWTLYGRDGSYRPDSPIPSSIDMELPSEETPSSPSSSPTSESISLTAESSSVAPTPTPPRIFRDISETPTPPPSSSPTTSVSVSTVRAAPAPNPIPWLNEIRDQVRGLWEGQLSTNRILDQLRDRPMPDNAELLERMARVEDLLRQLGDQARQAPPAAPVPPPPTIIVPPAPPSEHETELSSLDIDDLVSRFGRAPPIAPQAIRPGPSLAEQLDELLRAGERPPRSPIRMPEPVNQISILMPGDRSPSPPIDFQIPPIRVYSEPPPEGFDGRYPHPVRIHREQRRERPRAAPSEASVPPPTVPETEEHVARDAPREEEAATPMPPPRQPMRMPPPQPIPYPGSEAARRARTAPPVDLGGTDAQPSESWYRAPHPHAMPQPQVPPVIPGVAPPPGALGHTPGRQQQPAGAAPAPQLQYVPMPQAPITVPGMDDLLAAVRNTQLTTLANEAQTRELLRYMAQLNEWLDRDVRDRQAELRGVIANIEALRNQIASLGRGAPGEVPSESESSSSEDEGTPRVVYGQPPTMPMPIPGVPSQFPPGFVPQDEGPVIPPRMPDQGEGGVVPPVVPMGMPTPSGVPPAPIIINQPGQPGQFGPVGPPPVIPMDGFGAPGTGPMPMPVPQTVPVAEGPFIPPYEGGQPTVIQMQGSPSGSGDSSTSSSRSSSRSPSPRSRRRSSRSRSPRSLRDARHGSPTPIPVPPSVIRHDTGGPPIVTVPVPSYVPSELRSHTPRHPDAPSQAAGPTIINIPPQQVQQPGVPAGGIFPAPTVPGALFVLEDHQALPRARRGHVPQAGVGEEIAGGVAEGEAAEDLVHTLVHTADRVPAPHKSFELIREVAGVLGLRPKCRLLRSRSRSPIIIQRTGSSRRHESRRGSPPPQPVYIPTQPPIPQGQPPTVVVQQPRTRSRSSSRSSGRRTPIIVPVGTQPSQPPVIIPGPTGYAPTPGFPQPVPLTGVPITGVPITGVPPTGVPPTIVPSVYPGPPRTYRSRSRSPSRSRSRTPPSRRPTQRSDTQPVVVIPSGSYTDPARGAPYDPSQSRAGQRPPTRITRSPSPEYEDHRVPSHAPSRPPHVGTDLVAVTVRVIDMKGVVGADRMIPIGMGEDIRVIVMDVPTTIIAPVKVEEGLGVEVVVLEVGATAAVLHDTVEDQVAQEAIERGRIDPHQGVPTIVPTHAEEHEIPRHSTYAPTHGIPPSVAPAGSVYEAPRTATHPPGSVYEAPHSPPPAVLSRHPTGRTERSVRYEDEVARPEIRSLSSEAETVAHAPGAVPPRTTATPVSYPPRTTATPVSYPPRTTATPVADLAREEADRERLARLDDVENQLRHVSESAQQAEDIREEDFRRNEEDRQRLFLEQEERRDQLAAEARNALMEQATRFLEAAVPPAPPPALPVEEPLPVPPPVVPEELAPVPPSDVLSDRQSAVIQDVASQHAREIREVIDMEREEMAREREAAEAERQRLEQEKATAQVAADEQRDARIRELEEELARVRAELEDEKRQREEEKHQREIEDADLREREKAEREEQNESLRAQLGDITNLVNEQRGLYEEKKRIMDERHEDKIERRARKDEDMMNLMSMMNKMQEDMQRDRERAEEVRAAAEQRPGFEQVIAELERQNAQQRELLQQLSNDWRADCERHHQETLDAVRETADEQVPFNIQGYLDDFSKALATEVRILLGEVGKLREERRGLQHEIGYLLCIRSKYGPGGEFEPDWKPAPGQPGGPPVDEPPAPPPEPPAPPEIPAARPGWRNVYPRASRKKKKEAAAAAAAASAPPPQPDPRAQTRSWATWQPDPHFVPTPPSVEPTLLVPEASSPGLFGPRSPRSSRIG
ncbi:hypothetical protein Moror_14980, partial [Moniliophthora roreri MCA 2997]